MAELTPLEESEQRIADARALVDKNAIEAAATNKERRRADYARAQEQRVAGTVPEEPAGRPIQPEPEKEKPEESDLVTRKDVAEALNSLIKIFEQRFVTQGANRQFQGEVLTEISQSDFITEGEAKTIAREAVPSTLRGLDSSESARTGNQLLLAPAGSAEDSDGDSAYWGTAVAGISARGTKTLYYGLFLREYDSDGNLVAIGDEVTPLPAGHTLKLTYDVGRWI